MQDTLENTTTELEGYLTGLGLKLKARQDYNENAGDMWASTNHYRLTLSRNGRRMSFWYYQGYGIKQDPTLAGVIESLAGEYNLAEYSLDDFGDEFGWNKDTVKTHRLITSLAKRYERLIGEPALIERIDQVINGEPISRCEHSDIDFKSPTCDRCGLLTGACCGGVLDSGLVFCGPCWKEEENN